VVNWMKRIVVDVGVVVCGRIWRRRKVWTKTTKKDNKNVNRRI